MLVSGFHELIALLVSEFTAESSGPFKLIQILLRFSGNSGRLAEWIIIPNPQDIFSLRMRGSGGLRPTEIMDPMISSNPYKAVCIELVCLSLQTFGFSTIRPDR